MANVRKYPWLMALGRQSLPNEITAGSARYRMEKTFKHDFFAATGLYARVGPPPADATEAQYPEKVVLKAGRTADLFGFPMRPLGRWLARREWRHYRALDGVVGVPRVIAMWQEHGFVHEYVEGHPLRRNEWVNDEFFPGLAALLAALHARDMAYVDLEKRENILVGDDGRPYLIDFQISFALTTKALGRSRVARFLLRRLQESDIYHLLKHRRRHRPDQLSPDEIEASYRRPVYIDLHRVFFRPWTLLRRQTLKRMHGGEWSPREGGRVEAAGKNAK
jgi:hypothetical protein